VEGFPLNEFRKQGINIAEHTAVVFTNKSSIDNFFRICQKQRYDVPETIKYFCISELISNYVQKYAEFKKRKFFFPEGGKLATNEELVKQIVEKVDKKDKILVALSADNHSNLPDLMKKAKCNFNKAYLYRTVSNNLQDIDIVDYQLLAFFSPLGITSLFENFPTFQQKDTIIAAMGASTVKAVKDAGLRLDIPVPTPEAQSMPVAIELFLTKNT
jgi:uroporphyrinogen-III synthase